MFLCVIAAHNFCVQMKRWLARLFAFPAVVGYRTESREEPSEIRSVPVVSTCSSGSSGSLQPGLTIEQEPTVEPVQSHSSSSSPSEPGPPTRSRDPPPLLGMVCVNA